MIELSPETIAIVMLLGVLLGVLTGYPLAIVIGALGLGVGFIVWGTKISVLFYQRSFDILTNFTLLSIPLFVLMGGVLEYSGITDRLYDALYLWLGRFRGGLGIATVLLGTILAACVGIISASVSMLSIIALPAMLRRGYDKGLASGTVCASGCLGILIPPSIMLVVYGPMAGISVGKLFMAAFLPGLLLSGLYCLYISIRCSFQPNLGPCVPAEDLAAVSFREKVNMLFASMIPPLVLIVAVLGTIFTGVATPTEAAGVGAFTAVVLAVVYRKLNWRVLKQSALMTVNLSALILLIGLMSFAFTGVFLGAGGGKVVARYIMAVPGGTWGVFLVIMLILLILGMFIDWLGIVFIMVPIVSPIATTLGFDPVWFAMTVIVNLQASFLTPPFATAIFVCRGSTPPELGLTTADVVFGVIPFVLIIVVGLGLLVAFPEIVLWLPVKMIK
jgi:tripartite ATP-independent transporter DctM subunit